jgi:hypothetical protein
MSLWEAIECLRTTTTHVDIMSYETYLYLDELKNKLPNWATTLSNLTDTSYMKNLPMMNKGLRSCRERLDILKQKNPGGIPNAFAGLNSNLGVPNNVRSSSGDTGNGSYYVLQVDFNTAKHEIEETLQDFQTVLNGIGSGAPGGGSTDLKIDQALQGVREIEGRVTGEAFSHRGYVFCSRTELAD